MKFKNQILVLCLRTKKKTQHRLPAPASTLRPELAGQLCVPGFTFTSYTVNSKTNKNSLYYSACESYQTEHLQKKRKIFTSNMKTDVI